MQDFDIIVIGAGVAGLTAAMTAARQGRSVAVIDRMGVGGQIANAERIENFPGMPHGIAGHELGPLLHEQAEAVGAEFLLDSVEALEISGEHRLVRGATEALRARAVIVAAGSTLRSLGIPGEQRLLGKGVSHCASCDAPFFTGKAVCVIGGGDSAVDEAVTLAQHAARVTVIHRSGHPRAQKVLIEKATGIDKVAFMRNTLVEEILGEDFVTGIRLRDRTDNAARVETVAGVFVYVGLEPNTAFLRGIVALDPAGHIETDIMMQTSVAGIFAAGDIRKHSGALLAAAAGDGTTAAVAALRYLDRLD
jgi:thioredoxin reductase (NADPH)